MERIYQLNACNYEQYVQYFHYENNIIYNFNSKGSLEIFN